MCQRFEHITKTLKGLGSQALVKAMTDARIEFLNHCGVDTNLPNVYVQKTNETAFENWLKLSNTLIDGMWLPNGQGLNLDAVERARTLAFLEYEGAIMWNLGKILWKDHGEAYENHFYYFMCQIIKPYNMPHTQTS